MANGSDEQAGAAETDLPQPARATPPFATETLFDLTNANCVAFSAKESPTSKRLHKRSPVRPAHSHFGATASDSLWADLSDTARSKNLGSQPLKCIGHPLYQVRLACFSVSQVGLGLLVAAQCWKGDNPRGSDSISSSIKSGSGQAALGSP